MAEDLRGAAALVTGASSGIGEATARLLARHGAAIAVVARRRERLERLAAELAGQGARALVLETDVTDPAQAARAVDQAATELGRLDIVINNAGVMLLGPIEGADVGEWGRMVRLNVVGVLYVANSALPHLLQAAESGERRVADLVNVSSVAGRVAREESGVYNLTKFGVGAFSESLRQEVMRRHVRVALVEPGAVHTELLSHMRPEMQQLSTRRIGDAERLDADDIADAILYIVTRPRRMAVNEMLIRPTEQVG